ncbi:MAG: hypothetical protein JWO88_2632 [Frankiales bacterium]|nr:hypothetical protein [Frankiales bacterium]
MAGASPIGQHATVTSTARRWNDGVAVPLAVAALTAALVAGCAGSSTSGAAPAVSGTPSELLTSSTAEPTTSPSGSLPPEAPAVQGGKYYAVFLAVAVDVHDEGLVSAQQRAKDFGYDGGVGDINCTPGAREQLHLNANGDYTAFSILFATSAQAKAFVDAYSGPVVGTALVTAGCLD